MCRLFGLHAGREPVSATFWLLDGPNSLLEQSRRNPDGFGLGTFEPDGTPEVDKAPLAAHVAELFAREAREECSTTYVAHLRYASVGELTLENTHPFVLDGRIFGHNGVVGDLDRVEAELGDLKAELVGTTDSERLFALITRHIRDADGDVKAGIVSATRWLAENIELYSLNFVLATPEELWALRYPEGNELWLLNRVPYDDEPLDERGSHGEINVRMDAAGDSPVVVIASERMDDDERWREIHAGELVRVGPALDLSVETILPDPPKHQMELTGRAAASQTESLASAAEH
jgi:predicted glutamine amidotransferase